MTVTESAMLCLESWRGGVIAGRTQAGWRPPSTLLRGVREDAAAFDFVRDIFTYVELPQDAFAAALGLHEVAQEAPESLPARLRIALRVGGIASFGLPWGVLPVVKRRFHAHLADILLTSELPVAPQQGAKTPSALRGLPAGADLEVLGAPVAGETAVQREVQRLAAVAQLPGVKHLSLAPARLLSNTTEWQLDLAPQRFVDAATELLDTCVREHVTLTLLARSYAEALLMPELAGAILSDERYEGLRLGVEVLAELPESPELVRRLAELTSRENPLEVRVTSRSVHREEGIRSLERGLAVPVVTEADERDAQWLRVVETAFQAAGSATIAPVIATDDPVMLAVAQVRWQQLYPGESLTVAVHRGRVTELEQVMGETGLTVRQLTEVVAPDDFAHALPAVLETLSQVTGEQSPFEQTERLFADDAGAALSAARERVQRMSAAAAEAGPEPHRFQDRSKEWEPSERDSPLMYRPPADAHRFDTGGLTAAVMQLHRDAATQSRVTSDRPQRIPVTSDTGFACEPDTDVVHGRNRAWFLAQAQRAWQRELGAEAASTTQTGAWALDTLIERAQAAGEGWSVWTHADRSTTLRRGSLALVAARDRLIEVLASERGLPFAEIDAEIGYAIDSARYLASRAEGLRTVRGATFSPRPLTLVTVDAHTALGELAEMVLAALSAGSGVVLAAHPTVARTAAILCEELSEAGLPDHVVTLLTPGPGEAFEAFVERLTERPEFVQGLYAIDDDLARRVVRRAPAMRRDIRTRGVGTVIVTQAADALAAVPELVSSALIGAGTHHRAARAFIVSGALGRSDDFTAALEDAVRGVVAGHTGNSDGADAVAITMGPLPEPPTEAALRALTTLEPGESWLVQPEQLDEEGVLWSPGVRLGVRADSPFWRDATGVPVIGVVRALSLSDALDKQHEIGGGAVAGLWSFDDAEIVAWLERTEAAALAVNRGTAGARVERFPSGIWHDPRSTWQPLSGGPHRLIPLGEWALRRGTQSDTLHLRGLDPVIQHIIETVQPLMSYAQFDVLRRAALADELAWRTQFGTVRDAMGLSTEHNLLRYRRVAVHLRLAEGGDVGLLVRLLMAGLLSGSPLTVSSGVTLPREVLAILELHNIGWVHEEDEGWIERASLTGTHVSGAGEVPSARIRLIGGDATRVTEWLSSCDDVSVWARPVTMAGPVELLGFLREQAISIARTRYGFQTPIDELETWLDDLGA